MTEKKAIYKYENKINHKIYIGQTKNIKRRCQAHEHWKPEKGRKGYPIERAIYKYGIENFSFEILEWTNDYASREIYWIKYYNSIVPFGYNICGEGQSSYGACKEKHSQVKITEETARNIQSDLLSLTLHPKQIARKYNVPLTIVRNINSGYTWNYYNLKYPLRPNERELNKEKGLRAIELLSKTEMSFLDIGKEVGWTASQISNINLGTNYFQEGLSYPIRPNPKNYEDKVQDCIFLLKQGKTNKEIASLLGTSAHWVSRINVGQSHKSEEIEYPIRKK